MAHTNSTENYGLPQWIGTDKPTFLGDFNTAFGKIDTQMKANSDAATTAVATANSASTVATSANTNATTALNTANSAASDAASAVSTAGAADTKATNAQTDAASALRASAANSIENLAPAYDPTLTYAVGDLVTYIDAQNSGKLYKCIVAVNTPMEFNVNYWDDITVSEKLTKTIEASVDATNLTYRQALDTLFSNIIWGCDDYTLVEDYGNQQFFHKIEDYAENNFLQFSMVACGSNASFLEVGRLTISNSSTTFKLRVNSDATTEIISLTSETVGHTFKLVMTKSL